MNKRAISLVAVALFLVVAMVPALADHVPPTFVSGNSNCDSIGSAAPNSLTIVDPVVNGTYTGSDGTEITLTNATRRKFDFSTDGALVFDLIVKGSGSNHYDYDADEDGPVRSDINLVIPNGNKLNVVHFCYGGNQAPVAVDNTYSTPEDTPLTVTAPGVLGNDTDADGDTLTAIEVSDPDSAVTLNANGSFTFTPAANSTASYSFTYKANDGFNDSNVATVNITVTAVNDAPVANDDAASTALDEAVEIDVLANDTDLDSSGLTVTNLQTTTDEGGTAAVTTGGVTYTPATGFIGVDTFTYTANDGGADSNVATVTVTVFAGELSCAENTGLIEDDSGMSAIFFRLDVGDCEQAKLFTVNFDQEVGTNGEIEFLIDPAFTEPAEYTAKLTFEPFTPGNPNTQTFEWDLDNPGGALTAADWCESATFDGSGNLTSAVPPLLDPEDPEGGREDGCVASQTTQTVGSDGEAQTTWWVYFLFDLKTRG
jgi:hypothetical protein